VEHIVAKQNLVFGGFTLKLPDLSQVSILEAQKILVARIKYLDSLKSEISAF